MPTVSRKDYDPHKSILTSTEAARLLRISANTLVKLYEAGAFPGFTVPGSKHRRFQRSVIVEYAKKCNIPIDEAAVPSAA